MISPSPRSNAVATLALVEIAPTGCGQEQSDTAGAATQSLSDETVTTTTIEGETFRPNVVYVVEAEADDGGTERIELEIGALAPAAEPVLEYFPDPAAICDVDPARDALIPARVKVTNTTESFAVDTGVAIGVEWPEFDLTIEGAAEYSDGPSCQSTGTYDDAIMRTTWSATAPGETHEKDFYFVVHDYFSPEHSGGNRDALDATVLEFTYVDSDSSGAWERTCISGPGLNGGSFTFDGGDARVARALLEDLPVEDILDHEPEAECG